MEKNYKERERKYKERWIKNWKYKLRRIVIRDISIYIYEFGVTIVRNSLIMDFFVHLYSRLF